MCPAIVSGSSLLGKYRSAIRKLKQQRRWRLQKRHLKSEFVPLQTLSTAEVLAQSVERLTAEREVAGSIPAAGQLLRVLK